MTRDIRTLEAFRMDVMPNGRQSVTLGIKNISPVGARFALGNAIYQIALVNAEQEEAWLNEGFVVISKASFYIAFDELLDSLKERYHDRS